MRPRTITTVAVAGALLGAAGCGSDDGADDRSARTITESVQMTAPVETAPPVTGEASDRLSPEARALLDASRDLGADVGDTAQDFSSGRIDQNEAQAQLRLQQERATDLGRRARQLPAGERARAEIVKLDERIGRAAADVSKLVASGRRAGGDAIDRRIEQLRDDARTTLGRLRGLEDAARERLQKAFDRIGSEASG